LPPEQTNGKPGELVTFLHGQSRRKVEALLSSSRVTGGRPRLGVAESRCGHGVLQTPEAEGEIRNTRIGRKK